MHLKLSLDQKQTLMENVAVLLNAGIPLTQAFDNMSEETGKHESTLLKLTTTSIMQGHSLSETWGQYPHLFDRVSLHLIQAAEQSGTLVDTFRHLAAHYKQQKELREKLISALIYPAIIAFICMVVIGVIFFVIIPRIEKVFTELRVTIPWTTQAIINTSHLLRTQPLLTFLGFSTLIVFLTLIIKLCRQALLTVISKLPLIAPTLRAVDLAYSMRTLGTLLSSGVPIQESLLLTADTVRMPYMKKLFLDSAQKVTQGQTFTSTIKLHPNTMPNSYRVILEAGEQSGSLEQSCLNLADRADTQLDTTLKRATTFIEPILLLGMGLVVAVTMLSILSPIYQLIGGISG